MSRRFDRGADGFERIGGTAPALSPVAQPPDHGLAAWTFNPNEIQGGSLIPTAGRLELVRVRPNKATITNILVTITAAGVSLTAGRCFAALFTDGGGLLGAGAVTVDQAANWQSTGLRTCALSTQMGVVPGNWYRIGFFYNGTTAPTFARGSVAVSGAALNAGQSAPVLQYSTADTGLTTTMPNPNFGAQTAAPIAWWVALQ